MYKNADIMNEWSMLESVKGTSGQGYHHVFMWGHALCDDESAEAIHQTLKPNAQYTDQHLWIKCILPGLETTDGDAVL
jgi:hypothetical protein